MTKRPNALDRALANDADLARLKEVEELQRAIDEAELTWARLKSATKQSKEALDQLRFELRRVCLGLPDAAEEEAPLFTLGKGETVNTSTGEVLTS